ncbi:hypothetical protein BRDID11002_82340 [Bradyrhizobium diazoefficiens]
MADVAIVLDAEDSLLSAHDLAIVIAGGAQSAGLGLRQIDRECRAAAFLGRDLDAAAGLLDEADTMLSPSPVPLPTSLVEKNGSKIRSRIARRMPVPVSAISIST